MSTTTNVTPAQANRAVELCGELEARLPEVSYKESIHEAVDGILTAAVVEGFASTPDQVAAALSICRDLEARFPHLGTGGRRWTAEDVIAAAASD